ncbi:MAG: HepT-like ribonuclease domain-containing protein, partial [Polyangiales bacterium]
MGEAQLDLLERLLVRLEHYARSVSRTQLEASLDDWLMVSRALELAAQCCVDLAMEIVAKRGLGVPETYRDAFVRLAQAGILTPEASTALQAWAGLR